MSFWSSTLCLELYLLQLGFGAIIASLQLHKQNKLKCNKGTFIRKIYYTYYMDVNVFLMSFGVKFNFLMRVVFILQFTINIAIDTTEESQLELSNKKLCQYDS